MKESPLGLDVILDDISWRSVVFVTLVNRETLCFVTVSFCSTKNHTRSFLFHLYTCDIVGKQTCFSLQNHELVDGRFFLWWWPWFQRHNPQFWSTSTSPPAKKNPHSSNWKNVPIEDFTPKIMGTGSFFQWLFRCPSLSCNLDLHVVVASGTAAVTRWPWTGAGWLGWLGFLGAGSRMCVARSYVLFCMFLIPPGWGGGGRVEEDTATKTYSKLEKKVLRKVFFSWKFFRWFSWFLIG